MPLADMEKAITARRVLLKNRRSPAGDEVTDHQPACVRPYPNGSTPFILITTLDSLTEMQREQAVAHELGHVLVNLDGLVMLQVPDLDGEDDRNSEVDPESEDDECWRFLVGMINNAISHPWVLDVVEEYHMSNHLHLSLRGIPLDSFPSESDLSRHDRFCLYGVGVSLFDIAQTIPSRAPDAERLSLRHSSIAAAFEAANRHLTKASIRPDMPTLEQRAKIELFLGDLGCTGAAEITTLKELLGLGLAR